MPKRFHIQRGFTLIELMVVIIILAILSVYAATRFQGPSSFSPYAAQAQAISVIRQIQLARMQSNVQDNTTKANTLNERYTLAISPHCLGSKPACDGHPNTGLGLSSKVEFDNQTMNFKVEPSVSIITFDLLGRPTALCDATGSNCSGQYKITINDVTNSVEKTTVCINSQGFVYQPDLGSNNCDK